MSAKTAKMPEQNASIVDNSDIASLQVSLPQMLDLALGTPEVGAVNLNILHNFLHVLLHQINLKSTKVEYRGEDANRVKTMVASLKAGPTLHLHEYSITDGSGNVQHRTHNTDTPIVHVLTDEVEQGQPKSAKGTASVPVTAREKSDAENAPEETLQDTANIKKTKGLRKQIGPGTEESEYETIIFVEPVVDGIAPTALGFKQLEQSVNQLQQRFQALDELSTNPELVERLKGKITDPLTDMWQIINITKRLDASEKGIDKLTTMVQDVIKGETSVTVTEDTSHFEERLKNLESNISNIEQTIRNLELIATTSGEEIVQTVVTSPDTNRDTAVNVADTGNVETEGRIQAEATNDPASTNVNHHTQQQRISLTQLLGGINITEMHGEVTALKTEMSQIRKDLYDLNEKLSRTPTETVAVVKEKNIDATAGGEKRRKTSTVVESTPPDSNKLSQYLEAVENVQTMHNEAMEKIDERLDKLEKDVIYLSEKLEDTPVTGGTGDNELNELVSKIQGIQSDMEKLNETADRLIDDRENRDIHLTALLEQIELLKTIKADKEDLEDALADKADAQIVNRKVSHDQFDAACDDLARGLQDAVSKLGKQESIWQEALDEIQKEIESKVDQIEITPLKDFVTDQLKALQKKLKSVAEMRYENEAAGTKKVLRDVQCISCDKNVVMKMEEVNKFRIEPLPCSMSMKPYLTYELDQVRKQQRRLPHSRNMIQFEAALQEEAKKQKSARSELLAKTPRDHLCNRYCGGSHTVTTPQQRVMRMGHFLSQWGPKTVQLTEGVVQGTDSKMYRSRRMPVKSDVCGPNCTDIEESKNTGRGLSNSTPKKETRRSSAGSRRRSSKIHSTELPIKETIAEQVTEIPTEVPPASPPARKVMLQDESTIRPQIINEPQTDEIIVYETANETDHNV